MWSRLARITERHDPHAERARIRIQQFVGLVVEPQAVAELRVTGTSSHHMLPSSKVIIRSPIRLMTGTAIELPNALYLGPSGGCSLPL